MHTRMFCGACITVFVHAWSPMCIACGERWPGGRNTKGLRTVSKFRRNETLTHICLKRPLRSFGFTNHGCVLFILQVGNTHPFIPTRHANGCVLFILQVGNTTRHANPTGPLSHHRRLPPP
jgi:hypothetical protein